MRFLMLIPYTDLAENEPYLWFGFIEAASGDEAWKLAGKLRCDSQQLIDMLGRAEEEDDASGMTCDQHLFHVGLAVGDIVVVSDEELRSWKVTRIDVSRARNGAPPKRQSDSGGKRPPSRRASERRSQGGRSGS
jgi:hypothetical protein